MSAAEIYPRVADARLFRCLGASLHRGLCRRLQIGVPGRSGVGRHKSFDKIMPQPLHCPSFPYIDVPLTRLLTALSHLLSPQQTTCPL